MIALREALQFLRDNPAHTEDPMIVYTDSQSALVSLQGGPSAQTSQLGTDIWRALRELARDGRQIILQWVPSHCGLDGNERVDCIAKEASFLRQDNIVVDVQTAYRAAVQVPPEPFGYASLGLMKNNNNNNQHRRASDMLRTAYV